MGIHESGENYLEAILMLQKKNKNIRAIDICTFFDYSRPTVSVAMKNLKDKGYIEVDASNFITLTDTGLEIAKRMFERHEVISKALMLLGVDEETALEDACKIEHDISDKSYEAIKKHFLNAEAK
ncbi:MAG: metal-dependent transcriptional regulator [Ruminococcaceae bacterium]|nr:metal-dependent transcriptional regulator [Oscillospiraceae bacterium]